jgi:hypothetical protein
MASIHTPDPRVLLTQDELTKYGDGGCKSVREMHPAGAPVQVESNPVMTHKLASAWFQTSNLTCDILDSSLCVFKWGQLESRLFHKP